MGEFSLFHWLVVLLVILLIFGPKRLPELARSLGEGIREFKKSLKDGASNEPSEKTAGSKPISSDVESSNHKQ